MRRIRSHLSYANVMATLAVFLVVSGGTAVALNGSNTVFTDDIANDTQPAGGGNPAGGLAAPDLRAGSVASSEVTANSLNGTDIANFSLTNQDVGVLFAEVNTNGTLANSSGGGVTSVGQGAGNYEVDFARNIAACTAVATLGFSTGSILPPGEVSLTDTPGNVESVSVITWNSDGTSANKPFRLVVVC
jgi:hypothetical protein